jgi:hypothetical protein
MAKHSLSAKGLSLSQAQSISNMCNQRVREINNKLSVVNNASKTLEIGEVLLRHSLWKICVRKTT